VFLNRFFFYRAEYRQNNMSDELNQNSLSQRSEVTI